MNVEEASRLLVMAGKVSGHSAAPDPERVQAWAHVLEDMTFADAAAALTAHFRDPEAGAKYLMPAHLIAAHERIEKKVTYRFTANGRVKMIGGVPVASDPDAWMETAYTFPRLTDKVIDA